MQICDLSCLQEGLRFQEAHKNPKAYEKSMLQVSPSLLIVGSFLIFLHSSRPWMNRLALLNPRLRAKIIFRISSVLPLLDYADMAK